VSARVCASSPASAHDGHQQGDSCLAQVARALAGVICRPADHAARYGGEQFALVLPETSAEGAEIMAERVRGAISALALPPADAGAVTWSR